MTMSATGGVTKRSTAVLTTCKQLAHQRWAWLAMGVTASLLMFIIVPGEFVYPWPDETGEMNAWKINSNKLREMAYHRHEIEYGHRATTLRVYEHGWPRPFLARAVVCNCRDRGETRSPSTPQLRVKSWFLHWGGSRHLSVMWSNYDNWPLESNDWFIDYGSLLVDLLVATAILATVGILTHSWCLSRRKQRKTFQLRDLLLLMTLLALGLGIYTYHSRTRAQEGLAGKWLPPGFWTHERYMSASQDYCGPVWLRKLAGNKHFLQLFHHVTHATVHSNQAWTECYRQLPNYPYLNSFSSLVEIPIPALEQLKKCSELRQLRLTFNGANAPPPPLNPSATMGVDQLQLLSRLRLSTIAVYGKQVEARHVEQLAALPHLEQIRLEGVSVTEQEIEVIRRKFPRVRIELLIDWDSIFAPPS